MPLLTRRAVTARPVVAAASARHPAGGRADARLSRAVAEGLEDRRLFAAVVVGQIPTADASTTSVNLSQYFNDDAVEVVQFNTSAGNYRLRLFEKQKPVTVANFMKYVTDGDYDGTIVHRAAALLIPTPDIIQGGGYAPPAFAHIPTDPPINNEYATNGVLQNARGTIAMAKTSNPNSATSEWFVNVQDTSSALNNVNNSGGFTVFGEVFAEDLAAIDAIAALPRYDLFGDGTTEPIIAVGALSETPLRNYTDADFAARRVPTVEDNFVTVTAAELPDLTFTATSSNPDVVAPTVNADGTLALAYGAGAGSANVTVTATAADGTTAQSTFAVGTGEVNVAIGGDTGNGSVSFTDADGTVGTVAIKGPGSAAVRVTGAGLIESAARGRVTVAGTGSLALVTLTGTTAATTVTISGRGGDKVVSLAALSAAGPLKALSARPVALTSGITTLGPVGLLTLGSATGASISLGGSADPAAPTQSSVTVGALTDTDVSSNGPIRTLRAAAATGTDAEPDIISAIGGIDTLAVAGDLSADVRLPGDAGLRRLTVGGDLTGDVTAHDIGAVAVRGGVTGVTVTATHEANESGSAADANRPENRAIGTFKVGRAIADSAVLAAGSIGSLTAASVTNSRVAAGSVDADAGLPATLAALTQEATLGAMRVRSLTGTTVSAKYLGKLSVGSVAPGAGGFAGDRIASLAGTLTGGGRLALKNVDTQAQANTALAKLTAADGTPVVTGAAGAIANAAGDTLLIVRVL